jgi:acetyl-CoA carboxylase alpha subunit
MAVMAGLQVPSISTVIGEGGSGGALALGVADRVLMMENAIYSTISPEDAAELIYQDETRADEVAESLRLTAQDCRELGIVDVVVPEPPGGAHTQPDEAARQLRRILLQELADLQAMSKRKMFRNRYKKFRKMGEYSSHFRAAITREVNALQGFVATGVRRIARRKPKKPAESPAGRASQPPAR